MPSPLIVQPGSTTGKDTAIDSDYPNNNYFADDPAIGIEGGTYKKRGLFEWSISALPAGATITDAVVRFRATGASSASIVNRLRRIDWLENQATWNSYKTGSGWTTAGASSSVGDYFSDDVATLAATAGAAYVEATVTAQVSAAVAAALAVYSVRVMPSNDATGGGCSYCACENATADYRPKLTVTYTEGGGASILPHIAHYARLRRAS